MYENYITYKAETEIGGSEGEKDSDLITENNKQENAIFFLCERHVMANIKKTLCFICKENFSESLNSLVISY